MKLIDFLESQSQQFNNKKELSANRCLRQKLQHKSKEKFKFLNKEHIKEMQYVSLTIAIKLNNARIMLYHINEN